MVTCATIDKASHSAESFVLITSADPARLRHCYSEISDFSSRRAEFGRLAVLGCAENLPEPLDGVTV